MNAVEGPGRPRLRPVRDWEGFDWEPLWVASRAEGDGTLEALAALFAQGRLAAPKGGLWVFEARRRVYGAVGVTPEPAREFFDAGRVVGPYVHPEHRGRGYGQRLLARVLRHARGTLRRLTARAETEEARAFLEHHGFVPIDHPDLSHFRLVGKR